MPGDMEFESDGGRDLAVAFPSTHVLYAEDLLARDHLDVGTFDVSEEDILDFGRKWDPLSIHTEPDAAAGSVFGSVIASGIHTMAIYQRLNVLGFIGRVAVVAGKEIRDLKFENPVRPGARLHAQTHIEDVALRSKRADVTTRGVMTDESGARVLDMTGVLVVHRRTASSPPTHE